MSITPPENYVYGTVVGRFLATVVDSADADRFPDVVPATGTVTFTPNATYYKNTAVPATFVTVPQVGHLDAAGYLVDERNAAGVVLMATDHPDLSPSGWTYRVTMVINGRQFSPFDITVPAGGTVDLTTVMPAATSAGAITIVSEASRLAAEAARDEAVAAAASITGDVEGAVENYFLLHPLPENGLPDGGTTGQTLVKASNADGDGTWSTLTKSSVGLGNVDNTSDANKPVSTPTQTALNAKANLASPTFTGTVGGITKSMVGLGNADNTSDANKPVSTAQQTALNGKVSHVFYDGSWPARPTSNTAVMVMWVDFTGTAPQPPGLIEGTDVLLQDDEA